MSKKIDPAGSGLTADLTKADLEAVLRDASIPSLMMSMIHMSGDTSLLDGDIRPLGVYLNEYQGYMTEEDKATVRDRAVGVISDYINRGCQLPTPPDAPTIHRMMEFMVAEPVKEELVPMLLEEMELDGKDCRSTEWGMEHEATVRQEYSVLVIGAGVSGVLAAIRLREAGLPFTVLEKNAGVGGTWYENSYPGARVDVGNHFYSYSFEPSHHWTRYFAEQPELKAYLDQCTDKYDVRNNIQFNCEVTRAVFDNEQQCWQVQWQDADGELKNTRARAVICAVGQLNRPSIPDLPGADSFEGPAFHSARWDHSVDYTDQDIVVIGAGASGFQLVPEVAKTARQVTVFQRSAQWIFDNPHYHEEVSASKRWCLENLPFYERWYRFLIFWPACEGSWEASFVDPEWPHQDRSTSEFNDLIRQFFTDNISSQVSDAELLAKVLPDHAPLGKRTLQDNGTWLRTLQLDHVNLVREGVAEIRPHCVVASDGTEYPADLIVYATGFNATKFIWPMEVVGRDGRTLQEQWGDDPQAYLGITIPNLPNWFCMYGPGTNLASSGSILMNSECQVQYAMESLRLLLESGKKTIECKPEVCVEYNLRMREQHARMVWEHDSIKHSFYTDKQGKATTLSPWRTVDYWSWTRTVNPEDYSLA